MNAENRYLANFQIYQGKNPNSNNDYEVKFGKAATPLVKMMEKLPQPNLLYQIYIDNLFTNFNLIKYLRSLCYGVTGTICQNTIPKHNPLIKKKAGTWLHIF